MHGELWEKNILFHRKRLTQTTGSKRRSGKRKVFQNGHEKTNYLMSSHDGHSEEEEDDEDEVTRQLLIGEEEEVTSVDHHKLPYDVMLTDWKYTGIGSPTDDLAMLMLSSISANKRQKYTKSILKRYHMSFINKLIRNFGIDVYKEFPDYNYDMFIKSYELSLFGGFLKVKIELFSLCIYKLW